MMNVPSGADVRFHLAVLRCQAGDERAFAQIMHEFESRTHAYLSALVGDDADDVQQEVWVAVYRGIRDLANPAAFRTWLFRLTRHRAIDCLRKRKRERELLDEATLEFAGDATEDEPRDSGVDDAVLQRVLAGLPPPQREVLLLRYRDDLSYAEIALVTGCPIGTVRTRIHHARRKLSEQLNTDTHR
jgi:RNA polymerase sigma-70 factor (ECF subfamily)